MDVVSDQILLTLALLNPTCGRSITYQDSQSKSDSKRMDRDLSVLQGGGGALTCRPHGPGTGPGRDGQSHGSGDRTEGSRGGTCPLWPHVFLLANRHHLACCKKDANFVYE